MVPAKNKRQDNADDQGKLVRWLQALEAVNLNVEIERGYRNGLKTTTVNIYPASEHNRSASPLRAAEPIPAPAPTPTPTPTPAHAIRNWRAPSSFEDTQLPNSAELWVSRHLSPLMPTTPHRAVAWLWLSALAVNAERWLL